MCNQNNLTQSSLREATQRINTLFIFIFFDFSPSRAYFIIPLLYFFKKLVCYAPTHFFAWLCSTLQITYTRTPQEHCTTTTPIKTLHLFDKTSPVPSSTDQLHLNQSPPSPLWRTTHWIYFTRLLLRCHHKLFFECGFTYPSFLILYFFTGSHFLILSVLPLNFSTQGTTFLQSSLIFRFFFFPLFNLSLRLSYLFFRLLMECCSYAYSFPTFLPSLLDLFFCFPIFSRKSSKLQLSTTQPCVPFWKQHFNKSFLLPFTFFHLLLLLLLSVVVLFSNWNFNYF